MPPRQIRPRAQWSVDPPPVEGVVDFSRAAGARIVTSFATSAGPAMPPASGLQRKRAGSGLYQSIGGSIAAAEYMNEPTLRR